MWSVNFFSFKVSLFRHSLELRLTVKITLLKVWNSALAVQVLYKHPAL